MGRFVGLRLPKELHEKPPETLIAEPEQAEADVPTERTALDDGSITISISDEEKTEKRKK